MNGTGASIMDVPGTINPAELDSSSSAANAPPSSSSPNIRLETVSRGVKRGRSDDDDDHKDPTLAGDSDDNDESKPRKRGRPSKSKLTESPTPAAQNPPLQPTPSSQTLSTPQPKAASLPRPSPSQASPPRSTPNSKSVKALPTVRDHTLETLAPEGDEFEIRDRDDAGETKVTPTGHLTGGREYRCRTFLVPNRGDKLFMLATECARVLSYRDSYLLFNKNRSLFKIIASQHEKEDLIHQEILPFSYRSRQIAIVTARSMYRQFGARMIQHGRRVRDDYWEAKARKQGFTEEDLAGEKRPGQSQKKEPPPETSTANISTMNALAAQRENIRFVHPGSPIGPYQIAPGQPIINGLSPSVPMIDYSHIQRPRQDMGGAAYEDRTTSSSVGDVVNQASQIADFNKLINQQRGLRGQFLQEAWHREHQPTVTNPLADDQTQAQGSQPMSSPPPIRANPVPAQNQQPMMQQSSQHQNPAQLMGADFPAAHSQNIMGQSPMQQQQQQQQQQQHRMQQQMRPEQMHRPSYPYGMSAGAMPPQNQMYGYGQQNAMWPPPQPQTPMAQHQMQQFNQQHAQSPLPQQSPHHNFMPPQLHHSQSSGSMHGNPMPYQNMGAMSGMGYPQSMPRGMMQQSPGPQQFMHTSGGSQPGMQGWAPQQQQPGAEAGGQLQQGWQGGF